MAPRADMLLLSAAVLAVCSVAAAGRGGPGSRVGVAPPSLPPLAGPRDPAEAASRCCGPPNALLPQGPLGHPGPERCCGQGWGLHCCIGAGCCLGAAVVPQRGAPTSAAAPWARTLHESNPWWKDWVQWVNLGVVLAVVALVGGILTCCWHRGCRARQEKAFRVRHQGLLGDSGLYNYGATGPSPSAPHWNTPVASRWVDFSYKPPPSKGHAMAHANPLYRQGPVVRTRPSDSDTDVAVSPIFSSSDEEYRLVTEFKRKTKWPD